MNDDIKKWKLKTIKKTNLNCKSLLHTNYNWLGPLPNNSEKNEMLLHRLHFFEIKIWLWSCWPAPKVISTVLEARTLQASTGYMIGLVMIGYSWYLLDFDWFWHRCKIVTFYSTVISKLPSTNLNLKVLYNERRNDLRTFEFERGIFVCRCDFFSLVSI